MALRREHHLRFYRPRPACRVVGRRRRGTVNALAPGFFLTVPAAGPGLAFQKVDEPTPGRTRARRLLRARSDRGRPAGGPGHRDGATVRPIPLGGARRSGGNAFCVAGCSPAADGRPIEWLVTSGFTHEVDTVEQAATTPDQPQPFRELGLKDDEYQRIREILGRRPTDAELAMYSVMWSEHCSYKSSKVHLRYFGETTTDEMRSSMLAGIGENAGVVDIGDGWAVTFKVESHNHPSYVEPYQGAATGRRRHRPRHHGHGRPSGRRDGPAALRCGRRARHPARARRRGARRRRLRKLPGSAQHRRRDRLRRRPTRATRW